MDLNYKSKNNPKRQHLLGKQVKSAIKGKQAMLLGKMSATKKRETIKDLKEHLQTAIELEHSTIPPYLCALYSIKDGSNQMAAEIIKSVVIEEMLHMVMVANLLNAIGGKPIIGKKINGTFTPHYPSDLPGNVMPGFKVGLNHFSRETIRSFEIIEHPDGAIKDKDPADTALNHKDTFDGIGDFYLAILEDIKALEEEANAKGKTIFTGTTKQVGPEHYYGAGGGIITVNCLDDAIDLIEEIVGQGEGTFGTIFSEPYDPKNSTYQFFGPEIEEYAHYFRFKEVHYGRFYAPTDSAHRDSPNKGLPTGEKLDVDWDAVHKFKPNPKLSDYPKGSDLYNKTLEFNRTYMALLNNINDACNGNPDALKTGIPLMYDLKYKAVELMNIPVGNSGYTAGPSFEYVDYKPKK